MLNIYIIHIIPIYTYIMRINEDWVTYTYIIHIICTIYTIYNEELHKPHNDIWVGDVGNPAALTMVISWGQNGECQVIGVATGHGVFRV